jgi:hypothetical protein
LSALQSRGVAGDFRSNNAKCLESRVPFRLPSLFLGDCWFWQLYVTSFSFHRRKTNITLLKKSNESNSKYLETRKKLRSELYMKVIHSSNDKLYTFIRKMVMEPSILWHRDVLVMWLWLYV